LQSAEYGSAVGTRSALGFDAPAARPGLLSHDQDEVAVLTAYGVTHPGRVRKTNEDCFEVDLARGFFIVADGMGGHQAGDVASRIATEAIGGFLARSAEIDGFTWPFGVNPRLSFNANRLLSAVSLANRRVFRASEERGEYTGMGTTVVAALVEGNRVTLAGVGDSRIYALTGGVLEQLTRDDSWLTEIGRPSSERSHPNPMRHVLTNAIGAREQIEVVTAERTLSDGERLLLCSDGLHGAVDDEVIARILGMAADAHAAAEELVQRVLETDANDNITALVVQHCR
jgi:PPM family protein phosphatase